MSFEDIRYKYNIPEKLIKNSIGWRYIRGVRAIYVYDDLHDFIWSINKIEKDFNDLKIEINNDNKVTFDV